MVLHVFSKEHRSRYRFSSKVVLATDVGSAFCLLFAEMRPIPVKTEMRLVDAGQTCAVRMTVTRPQRYSRNECVQGCCSEKAST